MLLRNDFREFASIDLTLRDTLKATGSLIVGSCETRSAEMLSVQPRICNSGTSGPHAAGPLHLLSI